MRQNEAMAQGALDVAGGDQTVDISIIDCGTRISNVSTAAFMEPIIARYPTMNNLPALSFLIQHPSQGTYLFDLGVRKDVENLPPTLRNRVKDLSWVVESPHDVADVLVAEGIDLTTVRGIIWSHWHWDHTGDPTRFPNSTDLVVGPGFKSNFVPNYPTVTDGSLDESAWADRHLNEIAFPSDSSLIFGLKSHDFFGDGSFFLLDAPGHAIGHLMGLARTTKDTFVLMAADSCHHPGHFRPSALAKLPDFASCPGELLQKAHPHPENAKSEPFYTYPNIPDGQGVAVSRSRALFTREALQNFDAQDNVMVVMAHDATLSKSSKLKFFPEKANAWAENGWKEDVRWTFLTDFA